MKAEEIYQWLLPELFRYYRGPIKVDPHASSIARQGNRPIAIMCIIEITSWTVEYVIAPYSVQDRAVQCRLRDISFPNEAQVQHLKKKKVLPPKPSNIFASPIKL